MTKRQQLCRAINSHEYKILRGEELSAVEKAHLGRLKRELEAYDRRYPIKGKETQHDN